MATLNILSADLTTESLVITRNNPAPVFYVTNGELVTLDHDSQPVGFYRSTRPVINELNLENGLGVLVYTDGLVHAGDRRGESLDIPASYKGLLDEGKSAQEIADGLLEKAMTLDQGRPVDDISVVVLQVNDQPTGSTRRMRLSLPFG
jgi:serine phosphatase RsbU (regulator of sigma subunit)